MAEHIGQPTRSGRFIKVYLAAWGLLAAGALGYLAVLAFPPPTGAPAPQASSDPVDVPPITTGSIESKVLAEVRAVKGSLSEVRKDVAQLQEAMGERTAHEKVVETRVTALEERVASIDGSQQPGAGAKTADKSARNATDVAPGDGAGKAAEDSTPGAGAVAAGTPVAAIETGSISKSEIVFGEPVITRGGQQEFAVQLAASASPEALRQSWGQLAGKHAALAGLQPRMISPRSQGGVYRLIAGPVPTKADAERICGELRVGPKGCFATPYTGAPL